MLLITVNSRIKGDFEDFYNVLEQELEAFENKFSTFKDRALKPDIIKYTDRTQEYNASREGAVATTESAEWEGGGEDIDQKFCVEEEYRDLEQDVLSAMLDLCVQEAQNRGKLEEQWRKIITEKLREKVRGLEDDVFKKAEEAHNFKNTIVELRQELINKDEEIVRKNGEIKKLKEVVNMGHTVVTNDNAIANAYTLQCIHEVDEKEE